MSPCTKTYDDVCMLQIYCIRKNKRDGVLIPLLIIYASQVYLPFHFNGLNIILVKWQLYFKPRYFVHNEIYLEDFNTQDILHTLQ